MMYLRNVTSLRLNTERCSGCTQCVQVCPRAVFQMANHRAQIVSRDQPQSSEATGVRVFGLNGQWRVDRTEKISLIASYDSAIDPLIDFVQDNPAAVIDFRPDLPGAWTIREHAVHILDGDTFGYGRIRLAVAQPGVEVFVWDEEAWRGRARYETADALSRWRSPAGFAKWCLQWPGPWLIRTGKSTPSTMPNAVA